MTPVNPVIIATSPSGHLVVHVPPEWVAEFKEVVRRGMNFEHGEGPAMHQFADELSKIVPPGTPLPGTLFV